MRFFPKVFRTLFILALPFLFLSASIGWAVNSVWLYTSGFEKYRVSATTGLSGEELQKTARGMISYWNSGEELISLTVIKDGQPFDLFNEREKVHLKDVKALFRFDYLVFSGALAYVLAYTAISLFRRGKQSWRGLATGAAGGSILTLALMLAMGAVALVGQEQFARFWLQFHLFSFANDLWQLDPSRDYLIMLVPQGFWYDAVRYVVMATAGMAAVIGGTATAFLFLCRDS